MSQILFKFSAAAVLYAKNIDLIDEIRIAKNKRARKLYLKYSDNIRELRSEAYRNIMNFRDLLVANLDSATWGAKRIHKKDTHMVGKSAGKRLHWRWYDSINKTSRVIPDNGAIYFVFPDPRYYRRLADVRWKEDLIILSSNRLKVTVYCDESFQRISEKIMELREKRDIGFFDNQPDASHYVMSLPIDKNDPVGSASKRIEKLLRGMYLAQHPE